MFIFKKFLFLVGFFVSVFLIGCASQKSSLQYYDLPGLASSSQSPSVEHVSGKLIVERFHDYRRVDIPNIKEEDCGEAYLNTAWKTADQECKTEIIDTVTSAADPTKSDLLAVAMPKAIAVDFTNKRLFDQVVYADVPGVAQKLDATWRMVGLIQRASQKMIYYGAPVPLVSGYIRPFGIPVVRIENTVEVELKLENLKTKEIFLKKKYMRTEISRDFTQNQIHHGYEGWNISHYHLANTLRLIINDFLKDYSEITKKA